MMSESTIVLIIIAIGVATFGLRLSFILLVGRVEMPVYFQKALRYVPVAVLSALVMPALLYQEGGLALTAGNERLISGLVAMLVVRYTRNVVLTIGIGMSVLWLLQTLTL